MSSPALQACWRVRHINNTVTKTIGTINSEQTQRKLTDRETVYPKIWRENAHTKSLNQQLSEINTMKDDLIPCKAKRKN